MEPVSLGWECLVQSWIEQISPLITSHYKQMLQSLILRFGHPILYFLRQNNITVISIMHLIIFLCFYTNVVALGDISFQ